MAFSTEQIYSLVNAVTAQSIGTNALTVVDGSTLVSLGNIILSSQQNTEAFLETLIQRIGRTILSYRAYKNKLDYMVLDNFTYGAILQKLKVDMPDAKADDMYNLVDGQSVDHYIVAKPKVKQKLFVSRTPYSFYITIQRETLKEAFTGETEMSGFIGAIFGEVRNKIELSLEDLGRVCVANMVANSGAREVKLVTDFNAENAPADAVTTANALNSEKFLRYAISRIKETMDGFTDMSTLYNDGTTTRHTPYEEQRLLTLSKLERRPETVVQWAAFNEDYVKLSGYRKLNFWQSSQTPDSIKITPETTTGKGEEVTTSGIVAILHDRDALGIYKIYEDIATTPINARGMYYNTFWHEKQLWFNDLSENFVYFTLN